MFRQKADADMKYLGQVWFLVVEMKFISQRLKFEESDEGLPCVNTIEKVYIGLLITVFALGVISLFRLSHFKAELQKIFDSSQGLTVL